ncbi:MAG: phospholipase D family protein [Firmicutes bacterium]|nr:phospholipase D family protein [Bacillota bacterium]
MLDALQQASRHIRLAVSTVTVASVLQALRTAPSRGVQVDVLVDANASDTAGVAHYLTNYGATVQQTDGLSQALLLIDDQQALMTSAPWNYTVFLGEQFSATILTDTDSVAEAQAAWNTLWPASSPQPA